MTCLLPVIISQYFGRKRTAPTGLSYGGAGLGAFFFPPLFQLLLDSFDLPTACLIMGGLTFLAILGAVNLTPPNDFQPPVKHDSEAFHQVISELNTCHPTPDSSSSCTSPVEEDGGTKSFLRECEVNLNPLEQNDIRTNLDEEADSFTVKDSRCDNQDKRLKYSKEKFGGRIYHQIVMDAHILTSPHFFLITFTYIAYIMGSVTFLMILPDFVLGLSLSNSMGIMLLSLFSVTDLLGRLLPGWLPYFTNKVSNQDMYVVSIGVMGLIFFLYPVILSPTNSREMSESSKNTILICLTLLCGFVSGSQMILPPVVIADTLGQENTAVAFGLTNFFCGLLSFTRPFIFREYFCSHVSFY